VQRVRAAVVLAAASALLSACGISFADAPEGNEFWKSLDISGDFRAGSTLTAAFVYEQYYPADVPVTCELWSEGELLKHIGSTVVPAYPEGDPDVTPFAGSFTFDFVVDAPGTYRVDCYSNADEDNFIREEFSVKPAITPEPR
jgi:hypothetical protein